VRADRPCAWQLIYQRLKNIGELDRLKSIKAPRTGIPASTGEAE